ATLLRQGGELARWHNPRPLGLLGRLSASSPLRHGLGSATGPRGCTLKDGRHIRWLQDESRGGRFARAQANGPLGPWIGPAIRAEVMLQVNLPTPDGGEISEGSTHQPFPWRHVEDHVASRPDIGEEGAQVLLELRRKGLPVIELLHLAADAPPYQGGL